MKVRDYRRSVEAELARNAGRLSAEAVESATAGPEDWDAALDLLRDRTAGQEQRLGALYALQAGAFDVTRFAPFTAAFTAALQTIAQDASEPTELRRAALDHLANMHDEIARQVLTIELESPGSAAVSPAAALEMLARDDHGSAAAIARRLLDESDEPQLREQAVRVLGSDPAAATTLQRLLENQSESPGVRQASAVALRALRPDAFRNAARAILGGDDAPEIKATVARGLGSGEDGPR